MSIESDNPDRDAPPQLDRGTRQTGIRLYNERLVLSLVRQSGSIPQATIARLTGLSPPTVSAIVRQLKADDLLIREAPQRGRVGQPLVPVSLNPEGAYSLGVKIGRRRCEMVLMDLVGGLHGAVHRTCSYPTPGTVIDFVTDNLGGLTDRLSADRRSRIAGIGLATPFELWNWEEQVGAPPGAMAAWRDLDLQAEVEKVTDLPVYSCNDATAACAAELLFGRSSRRSETLYIFVAWFIGGGVVLNGSLFPGRSGYAGSFGQTLVPDIDENRRPVGRQLLHCASMYLLDRAVRDAGGDPAPIWESPDDWSAIEPQVGPWLDRAAEGIALGIVSSVSLVDFQAAIVDGAMPASVRGRLVERIIDKLKAIEQKGLPPFEVLEGSIGNTARVIGGASLPFLAKFMRDRELLFQDTSDAKGL